jgi:hypothetical protein
MATKLDKQLKREIDVEGKAYMLTLSPEGLKVTEKGKRKGHELSWKDLVNGNGAMSGGHSASAEEHDEHEEHEEETEEHEQEV